VQDEVSTSVSASTTGRSVAAGRPQLRDAAAKVRIGVALDVIVAASDVCASQLGAGRLRHELQIPRVVRLGMQRQHRVFDAGDAHVQRDVHGLGCFGGSVVQRRMM